MAISAVRTGRAKQALQSPVRGSDIVYMQNGQVKSAIKLSAYQFDEAHRQAITKLHMSPDRELIFEAVGWESYWIGAGEEKAVFLIIDPQGRAFALELLAKGTYLEGHLAEGHYFDDLHVSGLSNFRWNSKSDFDHVFSGRVRVREFVYGDTLAGPGLRKPPVVPVSWYRKTITWLVRNWITWVIKPRYWHFRRLYRDAHEANVMIEVLPLSNPERKSHYLFPLPWLEEDGRLHLRFYRLTPIDVRTR